MSELIRGLSCDYEAFRGVRAHLGRPLCFLGAGMTRGTIVIVVVTLFLLLFFVAASHAQSSDAIEKIKVIKISAPDKSAVIKTAGGALKLIRVGAVVEGLGKVVEIAEGLIVIEVKGDKRNEQIIFRLEDGKQTIERIRTVTDEKPIFSVGQPPQGKKR